MQRPAGSWRVLEHIPRGCPELSQPLTNSGSERLILLLSPPPSWESQLREIQQLTRGHTARPGKSGFTQGRLDPEPASLPLLRAVLPCLSPPLNSGGTAGPNFPGMAPASLLNQRRGTSHS